MPIQIINASGAQFGMKVNSDGSINTVISGAITIGSVSASVESIYIQSGANLVGSFYQLGVPPNDQTQFNSKLVLVYSGTVIGSVYKELNTGSYVQSLSYDVNGNLIGVSAWVGA